MLVEQKRITTKELEAYLYSLENRETNEKAMRINEYRKKCEGEQRKIKNREIQKIEETIEKKYKGRNQTKDKILNLLKEHDKMPIDKKKLEITKYMLYRVGIQYAENIIEKKIKRLQKRYIEIEDEILENIEKFSELDNVEEIDFKALEINNGALEKIKKQFPEEYTEEEKKRLIQKELDIIKKVKSFNSTPIPDEVLQEMDKKTQSKIPRFYKIRQKNVKIINTMEKDYIKLIEPRELEIQFEDAIASIKKISVLLNKSEYTKVINKLLQEKRKLYRNTKELKNFIKAKEKKSGISKYNILDARYARMETLRKSIISSTNLIKEYKIVKEEEQLQKLENSYRREKQFASVIENLDDSGINSGAEIRTLEEQIKNIKEKLETSKNIVKEQKQKIEDFKKELLMLWKIEIDTTISRKSVVEKLPETTKNEDTKEKKNVFKLLFGLKKLNEGKHACI